MHIFFLLKIINDFGNIILVKVCGTGFFSHLGNPIKTLCNLIFQQDSNIRSGSYNGK